MYCLNRKMCSYSVCRAMYLYRIDLSWFPIEEEGEIDEPGISTLPKGPARYFINDAFQTLTMEKYITT